MVDVEENLISCIRSAVVICVIGVTNTNIKIDKYLNSIMIYNMAKIPQDPAKLENVHYYTMENGYGHPQEYYWYVESGIEQQLAVAALELQRQEEAAILEEKHRKSDDKMVGVSPKKCCVVQNHDKSKIEW